MTRHWHAEEPATAGALLGSDLERGLAAAAAAKRLVESGANQLPQAPPASLLKLLARQFSSLIVWVLIGAAAISGALGETVDALAIIAIVIVNGLLGFVQEFRSERSLAALCKLAVTVRRSHCRWKVPEASPIRRIARRSSLKKRQGAWKRFHGTPMPLSGAKGERAGTFHACLPGWRPSPGAGSSASALLCPPINLLKGFQKCHTINSTRASRPATIVQSLAVTVPPLA